MPSDRIKSFTGVFVQKIPPSWDKLDPESLRQARIIHTLLTFLIITSVLVFLNVLFSPNPLADAITTGFLLAFVLLTRWLLMDGQVRASAILLTVGLWLTLVGATFINQFEGNGPFVALALVVIVAGLLLGAKVGFLIALLSTAVGFTHLALTQSKLALLPVIVPYSPVGYMITMGIIFIVIAGLIYLATSSLHEAVLIANRNEQAMADNNCELEKMRSGLEDQVAERTRILEQRTRYLQATIEVSRATASILDTQLLLQNAVDLVRDTFGLYYVGLFLLDPTGHWAVLRAGTGDAGKAMLAREHRIRFGHGMIGWSIANSQPRLAGDVDDDMVRLPTHELPDTRSEAAIPLRSRGRVLGALTVQSDQLEAFGEFEITTFQSLADQLATVLDNASLIAASQQAADEARRAYGEISKHAWDDQLASLDHHKNTYRFGSFDFTSATSLKHAKEEVISSGQSTQTNVGNKPVLLLPITVRDQVIGVINCSKELVTEDNNLITIGEEPSQQQLSQMSPAASTSPSWSQDEIDVLKAIADQLGVALDTARLYAETRQLADSERIVDQVSSEMRASLEIDTVLMTAARELRDALGLAEVEVRLGNGV